VSSVFIAGSRQISRVPAEVRNRLDTMIEKGFQILVGDANGADKSIQRYLAHKSYPNVLVHCMKDRCRNNVGNWPTREIDAPRGARGFDYYSLKDRAMAEAADALGRQEQGHREHRRQPVMRSQSRSSCTSRRQGNFTRSNRLTISKILWRKAIRTAWSESSASCN
jgi:hypothetical protein